MYTYSVRTCTCTYTCVRTPTVYSITPTSALSVPRQASVCTKYSSVYERVGATFTTDSQLDIKIQDAQCHTYMQLRTTYPSLIPRPPAPPNGKGLGTRLRSLSADLVCLEVRHEGKDVAIPELSLPARAVCPLGAHLCVVV